MNLEAAEWRAIALGWGAWLCCADGCWGVELDCASGGNSFCNCRNNPVARGYLK